MIPLIIYIQQLIGKTDTLYKEGATIISKNSPIWTGRVNKVNNSIVALFHLKYDIKLAAIAVSFDKDNLMEDQLKKVFEKRVELEGADYKVILTTGNLRKDIKLSDYISKGSNMLTARFNYDAMNLQGSDRFFYSKDLVWRLDGVRLLNGARDSKVCHASGRYPIEAKINNVVQNSIVGQIRAYSRQEHTMSKCCSQMTKLFLKGLGSTFNLCSMILTV